MHTVRYFDGKTYKWVGLSQQPNIIGKVCFSVISYFIKLECLIPIEIEITKLGMPFSLATGTIANCLCSDR